MSLDLLSVLGERENYDRFNRFVKPETLSQEARVIVKDIGKYYETNEEVDEIDWSVFAEWFRIVAHSSYREDKLAAYDVVFTNLSTHTPTSLAEQIVEKYVEQDYCQQIADVSLRGADGEEIEMDDIQGLLEEFNQEVDRVSRLDSFVVTDDVSSLVHTVIEEGYEWRMQCLNESIGNVRLGKLIAVSARPNVCKTTFLASEATYIASQMEEDECVLWFNNEEAGSDVKMRIIQAATGTTTEDIYSDPSKALANYERAINGKAAKIKVIDKADINTKDVEEFLRTHNVKLIVFDQLWKVHGFEKSSGTDTARLGMIFQWAREMAKKYAPVITVHQVKTEGEGVKWLNQSMLYLSGTIIQGEVDTLIMIGKSNEDGVNPNLRYVNICKNKGAYGKHVKTPPQTQHMISLIPETAEFYEGDPDNE